MGEGVPEKAAKKDAAKKFGISLRTLETTLKNISDQRAAYAAILRDFANGVKPTF